MNANVSKLLNEQINKEFYSAYLYLDFANYYAAVGLDGFENWYRYRASITPAMPEQMAQSRSMSPLCHAQSTKRAFTASATCRRVSIAGSAVRR
jgi:ferritin